MRYFNEYKDLPLRGTRSDFNGPPQRALIPTEHVFKGKQLSLPYTVVKPYSWAVLNNFEANGYTPGDQAIIGLPNNEQVIGSILGSEPTFESSMFQPFIDLAVTENRALEAAQEYGNLLMLVTMREAGETIHMIRTVFLRLWKVVMDMYKAAKRLNIKATIDTLSDLWLEYRYGWRPFFGEVSSIAEQLSKVDPKGVLSARGFDKQSPIATTATLRSKYYIDSQTEIELEHTIEPLSDITTKSGFNYVNRPNSRNEDWKAIWGLDWQSIASTAWELVPFSFVVDMFLNIGSVLQARDVRDQVQTFNGYLTCTGDFRVRSVIKGVKSKTYYSLYDLLPTADMQHAAKSDPVYKFLFKEAEKMVHENWVRKYGQPHLPFLGMDGPRSMYYFIPDGSVASAYKNYYSYCRSKGYWPPSAGYIQKWGFDNRPGHSGTIDTRYNRRIYEGLISIYEDEAIKQAFGLDKWGNILHDTRCIHLGDGRVVDLKGAYKFLLDLINKYLIQNFNGPLQLSKGQLKSRYGVSDTHTRIFYDLTGRSYEGDFEENDKATYITDISVVQRFRKAHFEHTFTADTDLSSGQFADLAALGWNFVKSLKS